MASQQFEDIVENFEFLDEWEDRYRYIIELGKGFSSLDPAFQVSATKVSGCASQVWLVPKVSGSGPDAIIEFDGTSDALIVKGLIGVLHSLYNGQTVSDALAIDASHEFGRLGLDQHLSSQRSNGLKAMVQRLREVAAQHMTTRES